MKLGQLISHWKQICADLLATIDEFNQKQFSYVPFESARSVTQIMLHVAGEEECEIRHGVVCELTE